jgi:AcrR family transcriptional regulator
MASTKGLKAERSETTRGALLRAGRELFAERGFALTSREDVVQRAGATRGAFHYHFRRKEDLFRAVYEEIEQELVQKIAAVVIADADPPTTPWDRLRAGCQAFLDVSLDPAVQRISLLDAPSVLGWETWREIDAKYGFGLVRQGLQMAMTAGLIDPQPIEPLAHILLGALMEGAMLLARAKEPASARAEIGATIDRVLAGLRASVT